MMIDDKKNRETGIFNPEDFFEDDFEVIYEGDLPELPPEGLSDNYKDVLSSLSDLDDTGSIDYVAENRTGHIDPERVAAREAEIEQRTAAGTVRNGHKKAPRPPREATPGPGGAHTCSEEPFAQPVRKTAGGFQPSIRGRTSPGRCSRA